MTKSPYVQTLLIEGADALAFAHAQFSSSVSALDIGQWQFSAWLDPQGRVRAFFHLARLGEDRLLLVLRGGSASDLREQLMRFVFRSKVALTADASRALRTGPPSALHGAEETSVAVSLGCGTHSIALVDEAGDDAWQLLQLRAGWPWIPDTLLNTLLASSLSLQRLQAVTIDKGCYPGQEIVARMHFRSGYKKHLHRVELSQAQNAGDLVRNASQEKGCLLDVVNTSDGFEALAVLNDDIVVLAVDGVLPPLDNGVVIRIIDTWSA